MLHWCYRVIHPPSYHAVTLKGHHARGTRTDVWACDILHMCLSVCAHVCVSTNGALRHFPSLLTDDRSTHLCLALSLPSRLCLTVRPRCDSMFPISERIGALAAKGGGGRKVIEGERQSRHSGLSSCLFSASERQSWWEKSSVYQMSLLNTASVGYTAAVSPGQIIISFLSLGLISVL